MVSRKLAPFVGFTIEGSPGIGLESGFDDETSFDLLRSAENSSKRRVLLDMKRENSITCHADFVFLAGFVPWYDLSLFLGSVYLW